MSLSKGKTARQADAHLFWSASPRLQRLWADSFVRMGSAPWNALAQMKHHIPTKPFWQAREGWGTNQAAELKEALQSKTSLFFSTVVLIRLSKQCRQVCLDRLLEWARLASPTWEQSNKAPNEGFGQCSFQPRWRDSAGHLTQVGVRENFGGSISLGSALAPPYHPSFLSPCIKQPGMSLCPRLPVAAGVFSPGCCTSPRPSRRWTPAPRCARLTRHWIWCLWAGWQEAAWTPHSPSPGKGRGKREGVRTRHRSHSPLQHLRDWPSKKPNPQHTWRVCCTGQNAAPSNPRHF